MPIEPNSYDEAPDTITADPSPLCYLDFIEDKSEFCRAYVFEAFMGLGVISIKDMDVMTKWIERGELPVSDKPKAILTKIKGGKDE